ncbi:unnamed protein product [Leptidea sinapis]|uniref:Uncharacterized protein n=1 Tax=Leptidea sinapis TaxID=189913 RepID=A0A5E4Q373_9NEOP|nr:unnamed protein product [Leptidea sinapis]
MSFVPHTEDRSRPEDARNAGVVNREPGSKRPRSLCSAAARFPLKSTSAPWSGSQGQVKREKAAASWRHRNVTTGILTIACLQ